MNTAKPSPTEKGLKSLNKNEKNFADGDFIFHSPRSPAPDCSFCCSQTSTVKPALTSLPENKDYEMGDFVGSENSSWVMSTGCFLTCDDQDYEIIDRCPGS
ncbi:MAG: hypothetical protein MUO63_06180 [Desulfobulbaceae bacterium]|nr:hypothetical protein [Desulfobulbaceae bacterium]